MYTWIPLNQYKNKQEMIRRIPGGLYKVPLFGATFFLLSFGCGGKLIDL